ncbi:[NiFe] hydrogenase metallocenter assembly protein HypE [Olavius algarvensis associated proteobacterium Delta 3]|nr:[NiFe] hydrogenase metallocenter assembly protein HypE [Olavius algarvensis associated proteobacterium Delta 3]CAB5158134.1 [NiFe] hydrogenase metallocenter assembly protein HypE [Olavius algarvensis associated proteobacterium Delta 3]
MDKILLDHGSGGKLSHLLTTEIILPFFDNTILAQLDDGAVFAIDGRRLAFSTDSYTVDPIFFPGGDIGDLAINGTVNDISMCGAVPLFLSAGLIIEEGFPMDDLKRILASMQAAAKAAGIQIVTGDTKVVPKGAVDKIFINTSGVGSLRPDIRVSSGMAHIGDRIIISGSIADHGVTILTRREGLTFDAPITSDTAPLNHMVRNMFEVSTDIHVLRDPTRGGLGTALNEIAMKSNAGIHIEEKRIPVKDAVAGLCELLGFDPLYLANEGKLIAFVPGEQSEAVLEAMKQEPFGEDACIIGEVVDEHPGKVVMTTPIGGKRIVDMLTGEQLPRIC